MRQNLNKPPISDLNLLVRNKYVPWHKFEKSRILIYGGTGFIGSWLTTAMSHANFQLDLEIEVVIVTRDARAAQAKFKPQDLKNIKFVEHDFALHNLQYFFQADYIFHAATPTRAFTGSKRSVNLLNTSINAANHAISCKSTKFDTPRVIHLSSGAIYGSQSMDNSHRSEEDKTSSELDAYGQAKLVTDEILQSAFKEGKIRYQSPRLFAFAGPLLQLDAHFAVGNFLLDGLRGRPISVNGSPNTLRSYMYPSDLITALLVLATTENYININIGSEESISMTDLAYLVSGLTSNTGAIFKNPNIAPSNYVPDVTRLKSLLPDYPFLTLEESLRKWIEWIIHQD